MRGTKFVVIALLVGGLILVLLRLMQREELHSDVRRSGPAEEPPAGAGAAVDSPGPAIAAKPFDRNDPAAQAEEDRGRLEAVKHLQLSGLEFSVKGSDTARIFGTWGKADGSPAAHHSVRAVRNGVREVIEGRVIVATAADGAYEAHLKPGRYDVVFGSMKYAVTLAAGEERRIDHRDSPGCEVQVRVEGQGIRRALATVCVRSKPGRNALQRLEAVTDAAGVAVLRGCVPGPAIVEAGIQLEKPGPVVLARTEVVLPEQGPVEVVLVAPEASAAVGVRTDRGEPVAGALVEMWLGSGPGMIRRAIVDGQGEALFTHLPVGPSNVRVTHPRFAPGRSRIEVTAGRSSHVIRLLAGSPVKVSALDDDGKPMRVILRAIEAGDHDLPWQWECRTDDTGSGVIENLPPGKIRLTVLADGCHPLALDLPHEGERPKVLDLGFRQVKAGTLGH